MCSPRVRWLLVLDTFLVAFFVYVENFRNARILQHTSWISCQSYTICCVTLLECQPHSPSEIKALYLLFCIYWYIYLTFFFKRIEKNRVDGFLSYVHSALYVACSTIQCSINQTTKKFWSSGGKENNFES